jgi:hypothetical protein
MDLGEMLGVDWIDLAQDRDRWRALVNAVMTDYMCLFYTIILSFHFEFLRSGSLCTPSGSINCSETIEWFNNWWPLE